MGIDTELYYEEIGEKGGTTGEFSLGESVSESVVGNCHPVGATHVIPTLYRYYGVGYERGPWPAICDVLLRLHASRNVGRVWYGRDSGDSENLPLCTPEDVLKTSAHYMAVGHDPYNGVMLTKRVAEAKSERSALSQRVEIHHVLE